MKWLKKILGSSDDALPAQSVSFDVDFGPGWEAQHEDTHFSWADITRGRQVVLTYLSAKEPLDKSTFYVSALEQIGVKKAYLEYGRPDFKFADLSTDDDRANRVEFSIYGADPSMPVQVSMTAIGESDRVICLTYYNYNTLLSENEFEAEKTQVRSVLNL